MPEYGLHTTTGYDPNLVLYQRLLPITEKYNKEVIEVRDRFCQKHAEGLFKVPRETIEFMELAEGQPPDLSKLAYTTYSIGCKTYGVGYGYTMEAVERGSPELLTDLQTEAFAADQRNITRSILRPMLTKGATGFWDGTMSEAAKPENFGQNVFAATHTHYYGANDTSPSLPLITAMKKHIREHGHRGPLWAFVNSAQVMQLENLAGWIQANTVPNPVINGTAIEGFQHRWLGVNWVENDWIPPGYILMVDESRKPVAWVTPPKLDVLQHIPGHTHPWPIVDSYWRRQFGTQVVHRSAGVAVQLVASTAYTNPTFV